MLDGFELGLEPTDWRARSIRYRRRTGFRILGPCQHDPRKSHDSRRPAGAQGRQGDGRTRCQSPVDTRLSEQPHRNYCDCIPHAREFLVVEERARAQAGAVEDQVFAERHQLASLGKFAHHDAAAGYIEIPHERGHINRGLD